MIPFDRFGEPFATVLRMVTDVGTVSAFLDDEVIAETVLQKIKGARSFYNTVIRRGESLCRPSPRVGKASMPRLISSLGGCMLTTSAEPG